MTMKSVSTGLLLLLSAAFAQAYDWRAQNDADRYSARMNELMRAEQRHTDGIIAGARADMARQTSGYYQRRAQERDARYAAFQKAVAEEDAATQAASDEARAKAREAWAARPHVASGLEVLGSMEKAARGGDVQMARVLGDAFRAGVGAAAQSAETAAQWYRLAADGGDAMAASALGSMYANGIGVPKDDAAAFRYTLQAAEGGDDVALGNAGTMYEFGIGTAKNEREAVRWYKRAADKGSVRGQSGYGRALLTGKGGVAANPRAAMDYLRPAAQAGDSAAQMFAANALLTGAGGVARDTAQAVQWYEAAARDFPSLNGDLASVYANGGQYGIARDDARVVQYARRGAEAGDATAMYLLADAYFNGRAVAQDDVQGRQWIARAAEAGDANSMYSYALCLFQGVGGAEDRRGGFDWLRKSADAGNNRARYEIGMASYTGDENGTPDKARAARYWRLAAEAGYAPAQTSYGYILEKGEGVAADPVAAREWARRSAEQGDSGGLLNYGDALMRGVGGARDGRGLALVEKAAGMGHADAAFTLGEYYRDGQYLPRDVAQARQWFLKAQALGQGDAEAELRKLP